MTDSPNTPREFNDDALDHVWDDPRVTSYVMHELTEDDLQAFEAELEADPTLQLAVQQAKEIASELETVFAAPSSGEAGPLTLEPQRKEAILAATKVGNEPPTNNIEPFSSHGRSTAVRLVITLLASAAAIIIVLNVAPRYTDFDVAEYSVKEANERLDRDLAGNAPPADSIEAPPATGSEPEFSAAPSGTDAKGAETTDTEAPVAESVVEEAAANDAGDESIIGEMKDEPTTKPRALGGARMGAANTQATAQTELKRNTGKASGGEAASGATASGATASQSFGGGAANNQDGIAQEGMEQENMEQGSISQAGNNQVSGSGRSSLSPRGAARSLNMPAEAALNKLEEGAEGNGKPKDNSNAESRAVTTAPAAMAPVIRSLPAADSPRNLQPSAAPPNVVKPNAVPPQAMPANSAPPRASQPPTQSFGAGITAPRRSADAVPAESVGNGQARGDADAFGSAGFGEAAPMKPDASNAADKSAAKSEGNNVGRKPLAMNSLQQITPRSNALPKPQTTPGDGDPFGDQQPADATGEGQAPAKDLFGGRPEPQAMRQQGQQPMRPGLGDRSGYGNRSSASGIQSQGAQSKPAQGKPMQSQTAEQSGQQADFGVPSGLNGRPAESAPARNPNGSAEMAGGFAEAAQTPSPIRRKLAREPEGQESEEISDGSRYERINAKDFLSAKQHPESTFSVDVDTASYAKVRELLRNNTRPSRDAVRIEEMVNYFEYDYQAPKNDEAHPFRANVSIAECPWYDGHQLARVAIQGRRISNEQRPACNLVFLIDTSGSMSEPNKLPLVVFGMKALTKQLRPDDRVTIVTYAGSAGVALNGATGDQREKIISKLDGLTAAGRTNGSQGIKLAYDNARNHFIEGGVNRVILCSDGDFNVGMTDDDALVDLIKEQASSGVFLTALGFGMDNHNDAMMEKISGVGNGNYAFINSQAESTKVLGKELNSTLVTIAKDVKLQIKFDPQQISQYRLIGYENRMLAAGDIHNDQKDGGDIGAGHQVTAFYELIPTNPNQPTAIPVILPATADGNAAANAEEAETGLPSEETDPVETETGKSEPAETDQEAPKGNAMTVLLSYKKPDEGNGQTLEIGVNPVVVPFDDTDQDFRFAASVASFGMQLRNLRSSGINQAGTWNLKDVIRTAKGSMEKDRYELKAEFVELVEIADKLNADQQSAR